ncbi:MAG: outer membrane protein transport protein [Luteolibacter sp.]|uniref:OmpP1/FadL family transporter n=1 Tax=Luteolibacter sp. TaxID=1962973 RepID=UPI003264942A
MTIIKTNLAAVGILLGGLSGNVLAVGFRLPNQDPEGIARGNAFAATADNPAAIYYNPAGICQLEGQQLSVGSYFISTNIDYKSPTGETSSTVTDFQAVPQIYYVYSPEESKFSMGLGLYAPYGLGIEYEANSAFPTIADEAKLLYACFNPVVAYEICPGLSVAAGITLNYSDVTLERDIGLSAGDRFKFDGDGYATGFNLGLLWQPRPMWSFGLNYRSATNVEFKGESIASPYSKYQSTEASLEFPDYIVGGISFRPDENWNFEFDLDWTDWDSVNDAKFKGTFGGDQTFPFRYTSGFMYEFGVTRQLGDGYFASAGYIYSENNSPDATFSPLNPDSDLNLGSIGFGHRGDSFSWAVGYHFAYNSGREVSGNQAVSPLGETVDGEYHTFNHAVNVSVRYRF